MKGLIFTYLAVAYGAGIGLFRPFYALCVYVCFGIIKPEVFWGHSVVQAPYSKMIAIPMLLGWIFGASAIWKLGAARPIVYAFTGFVAWGTLSAIFAENTLLSLSFFSEPMLKILLPFFVGITTINSTRDLRILCWTIILSQGFIAYEMNLSYLKGFNVMADGGTLENNSAAISMVAGAGFAVMIGFLAPSRFQKWVAIICSAMMVHAVLMSDSRGGMLGVAIMGAVILIVTPKNPKTVLAFVIIGLLVLRFTGPAVIERFATAFAEKAERDESAAGRLFLWMDCRDLATKHPLLGIGPQHWRTKYAKIYGWPDGKSAHSTWFELAAETGIPGITFLISFYLILCWKCWRWICTHHRWQDPMVYSTCSAAIVATVGYAVSASFVTYWGAEISYYSALAGAAALRLSSLTSPLPQPLVTALGSSQPLGQPTA